MKKLATLILVSFSLFGLFACEKEEEPPTHFTGYVLEAGTGNPVRKANVAILCKDHETGGLSIAAETISDDKGFYSIENKYQADGKGYYLIAESSDHFPQLDYIHQKILPQTETMDITLYRIAKLMFHVKNVPPNYGNESITIYTPRQISANFIYNSTDTIFPLLVNANIKNNIKYSVSKNGSTQTFDTTILVIPNTGQLVKITY